MSKSVRASVFALLLALGACGWTERAGDFTYTCADGIAMFDGSSCRRELTDNYLLRYGEGSGDYVVLAYRYEDGSGGLFDFEQRGEDVVTRLGLDDRILVAQTRRGHIYVAPAHPDRFPQLVGPLTEEELAARYPNAPPWRDVQ